MSGEALARVSGEALARLDHVSLELGEPAPAACARLGLRLTPTPGPDHGRVLLDRRYLEVRHGQRLAAVGLFFALSQDRRELEELRAAGLEVGDPEPYQGRDGVWEDCVLTAPSPGGPIVALTRRVGPPELARDWPPPLERTHPNGAETLDAVHLAGDADWLAPLSGDSQLVLSPSAGPLRVTAVELGAAGESLELAAEGRGPAATITRRMPSTDQSVS